VTLEAKLNYRKFAYAYTDFAYAGRGQPGSAGLDHDSPSTRSMPRGAPICRIVTLAHASARIELGEPSWQPAVRKQDRERWNDWGIGLLRQGDLKAPSMPSIASPEPSRAMPMVAEHRAVLLYRKASGSGASVS